MECESSVKTETGGLAMLNITSVLLPPEEYTTRVTTFPGKYAFEDWALKGDFFITFKLYNKGRIVGEIYSRHCDEKGYLDVQFSDLIDLLAAEITGGLVVCEFNHTSTIPVELYFSHVHKETGAYIAYPALPYMGDQLFPVCHTTQLENTLFWPGIVNDEMNQESLIIINPYKLSFSYQISLFTDDRSVKRTEVLKCAPRSVRYHAIEEIFPEFKDQLASSGIQCSICVAAQYKVVAYMMIKNRARNIITAIDHLHPYCLY